MKTRAKILAVLGLLAFCSVGLADELLVPSRYPTIQSAIDAAFDGDEVIVAPGTYTGDGNRDIDFLGKAITVRSESGPENCIIDCQGSASDKHRGFYFHSREDHNSVLVGFTITNGYVSGVWSEGHGGGIYCEDSSPTIINCTISENREAGIYCEENSNPTIINCTISGNTYYAGIYCEENSSPTINNCTITGNWARNGGGIYCSGGNLTINNCTITGNWARNGGGIYCSGGSLTINNCTITGNSGAWGGGICLYYGSTTITNCTITGNSARHSGGGIKSRHNDTTVNNCIVWANEAPDGPQIYLEDNNNVWVSYTNLQGGPDDVYIGSGCTLDWEQGNIDADPRFVLPGYRDVNDLWVDGDYHLLPDSPCIDAGDPNYVPEPNETDLDGNPRVNGGRIDMGAYESVMHEARLWIWPRVINRKSRQPRIMAWLRLPQGITKDQIDKDVPLILYPGGIKAVRQFVFQNRRRGAKRTSVFAFFNKAELMDAIDTNGRVQLMVLGHLLEPGRYFYGSDTVRITARRLPRRPHRRRR